MVQGPVDSNKKNSVAGKVKALDGFFYPEGVAVIGASSNSEKIGYQVLNNVIKAGFAGKIYPINPKDDEILGQKHISL